MCPVIATTPAASAAATISPARAAVIAIGFSTRRCLPAAMTFSATSGCSVGGRARTTPSIPGSEISPSRSVEGQPNCASAAARRSGFSSATAASTPSSERTLAWFLPQSPQPIVPIRKCCPRRHAARRALHAPRLCRRYRPLPWPRKNRLVAPSRNPADPVTFVTNRAPARLTGPDAPHKTDRSSTKTPRRASHPHASSSMEHLQAHGREHGHHLRASGRHRHHDAGAEPALQADRGVDRAMEEDREAVIVAASGAPLSFVFKPAILLGAIVAATVLLVSAFVEPLANREVRNSIALLTTDIAEYVASQGILTEIEPGLFVRGGTRAADGQIKGLFILDKRDPAQEIIYIAEGGRVAEEDGDLVLEMFGGAIHVRATATGQVHRFEFGRYMSSVPWFEGAEALAYRPRETTTPMLLASHLGGAEVGFRRSEARSELVRRFTDWLYPFAYLGVGAVVLILSRGNRFAYRWMMPVTLVAGVTVKAAGLAMIGSAGTAGWAVIAAFVLPVAAALSPFVVGAIRAVPRLVRS